MTTKQFLLPIASEITVDLFAGGGGASTVLEQALGRHVDIAVNHDPEAIALHTINHPQTEHYVSDVFEINPHIATRGRPVGLLWASPDCKHFSKAKGGKPVSKRIRGLAWVVVKWAKAVRPRVIILENVEEFQTWGPLTEDGMPCPERKGQTFQLWKEQLRSLGYRLEYKELRACQIDKIVKPAGRRQGGCGAVSGMARCGRGKLHPVCKSDARYATARGTGRKATLADRCRMGRRYRRSP